MIKLFGRTLPAVARGLRGETLHPETPLTSRFRVLPHDIDANLHLNNGRYLQFIDVNRMEWLLRTRVLQIILKNRWKPILGSTSIQFRRELRLWETGVVSTRLAGWDDRWVFLEHRVDTVGGRPVALALAKAGFRCRDAWVPVAALLEQLPYAAHQVALPTHVAAGIALDEAFTGRFRAPRSSEVSEVSAATR